MNAKPDQYAANPLAPGAIPMPRLSDDAVIQIHDFIHHVLDLFEAHYGEQIHRFYQDLFDDNLTLPDHSNLDLLKSPGEEPQ